MALVAAAAGVEDKKMKIVKKLAIMISLLTMIVLVGCSNVPSDPGEFDALAQCLTEQGVTMYGTEWCSHCKAQKETFGSSFQYIDYIDCDNNRDACVEAGVEGYPTWSINGKNYPGEQPLERLASLAGC